MFGKTVAIAALLIALPAAAGTPGSSARVLAFAPERIVEQVQNAQTVLSREELRSRLAEQRDRANRLQAELVVLRQDRDRLAAQVERLRDARPEKNAEIRELRQEVRTLREQQIELEAANDRKDLRIEELRTRLDVRNGQVESLRADNETMRGQLAAIRDVFKPQQ